MPENTPKTLFIASDHGGYPLKESLKNSLSKQYNLHDLGTDSEASVDYPELAHALADKVVATPDASGILICGTGIGMSITANRHRDIRAALVHNKFTAQMAKEHNNANIIVLGGRVLEPKKALELVELWLNCKYEDFYTN